MTQKYSKHSPRKNKERDLIMRRNKRHDVRAFIRELMGGACIKCGNIDARYCAYTGKGKGFLLNFGSTPITVLMEQSKDFSLFCKKCWFNIFLSKYASGTIKHGTVSGYVSKNSKCRCRPCRDAWNEYTKAWHKKKYVRRATAREAIKKGTFDFLKK